MLTTLLLIGEQRLNGSKRLLVINIICPLYHDHKIAALRLFQLRGQQTEIFQNAFVHLCRHRHKRLFHTVQFVGTGRNGHQRDGVKIRVLFNNYPD
ncbi:hypothetical protein D3C86_1553000 [compost metagenome]